MFALVACGLTSLWAFVLVPEQLRRRLFLRCCTSALVRWCVQDRHAQRAYAHRDRRDREREREGERERDSDTHTHTHAHRERERERRTDTRVFHLSITARLISILRLAIDLGYLEFLVDKQLLAIHHSSKRAGWAELDPVCILASRICQNRRPLLHKSIQ